MRLAIASVKYADCLAVTLPAWLKLVPKESLVVATAPGDTETKQIAHANGVMTIATDAWTQIDPSCHVGAQASFNLGLGLDVALGLCGYAYQPDHQRVPPAAGEIIGHVSADCYPFGKWPADETFRDDTVYGFWRYQCDTQKDLEHHVNGKKSLKCFPKLKNSHGWPIGYCQIFRHQPGRRFGSYPTAGKFDTNFSASFPRQEMRSEIYFLHMGPISIRENWAGRVVPTWA